MARGRKTVDVAKLVELANNFLAKSVDGSEYFDGPSFRQGVAALVEAALMDAGAYRGYSYIGTDQHERDPERWPHPGMAFPIQRDEKGHAIILEKSRRQYFA